MNRKFRFVISRLVELGGFFSDNISMCLNLNGFGEVLSLRYCETSGFLPKSIKIISRSLQ
jgi:hypothetical protein